MLDPAATPDPTGIADLAEHAAEAESLLKGLANQNRLMICCCLGDQELSVSELNAQVPLSQSALSQHLARLRLNGIVATRRDAQVIYYRVADKNAMRIISTLKSIYCP